MANEIEAEALQSLYDNEINFSISCFWDGGFDVKIGDEINGFKAEIQVRTAAEAIRWLKDKSMELYNV